MKKLKYKYGGPGDDKLYQANLPEVTVRSKKESPYKLTVTDRKSYENSFQDTPKTLQEKKDWFKSKGILPEQESRLPALSDLIYNTTSPFSTSYYERPVFGGIGAAVDMLSLDSRFDNYPEESSKNLAKQKKAVDKFYQDDKKTPKDVKDLWAEAAVGNVYPDVFYYNNGVQTLPAGSHTVKNKNSYYNFTGYSVPHSTIPLTQKANISSPLEEDAWNVYLGNPAQNGKLRVSDYAPSKAKDINQTYYSMSPEIESNEIQSVLDMLKYNDVKPNWQEEILKSDFITGEKGSRKIAFRSKDPALINYSAYEGKDSKGPYISYYDIWDLKPNKLEGVVGKPFDIYGRVYYDSDTYKVLPEQPKSAKYQTGGYLNQNVKKKKYAKGGFYGNEGGQQTSELLGQGIAGAANMIVPGAGAVLNVATGLTKMGMAGIDRLGPQAGDSYLGTDTRRMYDQSVDSGVANVLRNLAPIPGSIGQIAGITGSLLDMNKRKKHTEIPMVAGYAYGGPTYPVMQQDSLSPMMSSLFPPQNFYNGMPLPPQPLQVMNASIPSFDFLGASMGQGTAKQKSRDKIYEKAYGGDIPLSQDSFQVKGNPNTTDGNHYGNVSLDHDEVVKDNFVFSNKLFNPLTGETFAKEANRIEKSTGKIERRTASNPHDLIASNTLKQNEMMSNQLRNIQERVATQLGLRNDDGSTKQEAAYGGKLKYRNGGKTKGDPQPLIGTPQWFGNMASLGNGMSVPDYVTNQYANLSTNPYTGVLQGGINPIPYDMPAGPVANFDQLPSRNNYTNVGIPSGIDPWTGQASDNPTTFRGIDAPARAMPDVTKLNPFSGTPPTIPTSERSNPLKDWTLGDTLQAGSALSMFRGLGKGAYENPLYQDNTPISSNYVRPDSRLRSNSDSYNQATRSIDTNSANTFNSLQANLAASKYKADNQVLEGTNQMNRGYKQNYEQMLSQRLQQNQARAMQRDQQNLQSKAAYDQAMQAAFSTVNNFGQALNQKKEGKDSMAMLAKIFPQVYSGVFAKKYGGTIQTMFN